MDATHGRVIPAKAGIQALCQQHGFPLLRRMTDTASDDLPCALEKLITLSYSG
jgi:hypothetical protein